MPSVLQSHLVIDSQVSTIVVFLLKHKSKQVKSVVQSITKEEQIVLTNTQSQKLNQPKAVRYVHLYQISIVLQSLLVGDLKILLKEKLWMVKKSLEQIYHILHLKKSELNTLSMLHTKIDLINQMHILLDHRKIQSNYKISEIKYNTIWN